MYMYVYNCTCTFTRYGNDFSSYELRCIIWNTDDVVLEDDASLLSHRESERFGFGFKIVL